MKLEFGEVLVIFCLTLTYATGGGLTYCLGLMQSVWIEGFNSTTSSISVINSVTFAVTLLPAPAVQGVRDYFNIPPYFVFILASIFVASGLALTSIVQDVRHLLISNGIVFAVGIVLSVTGTLTSSYHYFMDDKITLVSAVVSSGMGWGMIAVSMMFKYLEPVVGWRKLIQYELLFVLCYIGAAIILCPPVSSLLGISTRKCKQKQVRKLRREMQIANNYLIASENESLNDASEERRFVRDHPSDSAKPESRFLVSLPDFDTMSHSIKKRADQILKNLILNPSFLLLMFSWILSEATYNAVMVHQPERIVKMGYSLASGADTLAINGAVQVCARFGVALFAERGIISVIRLSQISKAILGIFTILSNLFPFLMFQTIYMFLVGFCGGMVATTDIILIKDCVSDGRELAIAVMLMADGIASLLSIAGSGMLFTRYQSYDIVFYGLGGLSLLALFLVLVLEFNMRRQRRESARYISLSG